MGLFLIVSRGQNPERAVPLLASNDEGAIRRAVGELLAGGNGHAVRSSAPVERRQKESGKK